jgi:arylsulfatase A-like enzyme
MPSAHSAIVLIIDRLGAGYLGPYGNTWLETPGFNQFASQSLLCEQMLVNSPALATTYQSYWRTSDSQSRSPSLPQLARAAGCRTVLVTDDEDVAQFAGAADFDELHLVRSEANSRRRPAAEVEETAFIRLLEAATEQLEAWKQATQPQLLWIHARAMHGPWDAPIELRQQFADEDDPQPLEDVTPPQEMLAKDHDPDYVLSVAHAYAGQVTVVDMGLQALLTAVEELPQRDSLLLAVTSPRGYPLGEHLRVGECDGALYGELLHVPGLLQFPQREGALARTQELIQPADLCATIADGAGWTTDEMITARSLLRIVRGEEAIRRDIVLAAAEMPKLAASATQRLVRTTAWQLRIVKDESNGDRYELYAKPDDRWECNDVANRAEYVVRQLAALAEQPAAGELTEELTSPWR